VAPPAQETGAYCAAHVASRLPELSQESLLVLDHHVPLPWSELVAKLRRCVDGIEGAFWELRLGRGDWPALFDSLAFDDAGNVGDDFHAFLCTPQASAGVQGEEQVSCSLKDVLTEALPLFLNFHLPSAAKAHSLAAPLGTVQTARGGNTWQEVQPLLNALHTATVTHATSSSIGRGGPRLRAAVCIAGLARSFAEPVVYESIAQNATGSLEADVSIFYVIDMQRRPFADFEETFRRLPPASIAFYDAEADVTAWERMAPCELLWTPCHKQFEKLHTCLRLIEAAEASSNSKFDWLVRLRPDVQWNAPIGGLSSFDNNTLHLTMRLSRPDTSDPLDMFALVPRQYAEAYFRISCPTAGDVQHAECVGTSLRNSGPGADLLPEQANKSQLEPWHGATCECALKATFVRHGIQIQNFPPVYRIARENVCRPGDPKCLQGWI